MTLPEIYPNRRVFTTTGSYVLPAHVSKCLIAIAAGAGGGGQGLILASVTNGSVGVAGGNTTVTATGVSLSATGAAGGVGGSWSGNAPYPGQRGGNAGLSSGGEFSNKGDRGGDVVPSATSTYTSNAVTAGGDGGDSYADLYEVKVPAGGTINFTIGAGGAGGNAQSPAGAGPIAGAGGKGADGFVVIMHD